VVMSGFLKKHSLVNRLIFPAPTPTYGPESFPGELIWVPEVDLSIIPEESRFLPICKANPGAAPPPIPPPASTSLFSSLSSESKKQTWETGRSIPCLFLYRPEADYLLIFCHGNGEDLGGSRKFLTTCLDFLDRTGYLFSVLAIDYPGYGMCTGPASECGVLSAAESVYRFCRTILCWAPENIWMWGVSIGTGPSCSIASRFEIGGLILISAYESIRAVVKHLMGSTAQYLISDRFENFKAIEKISCPVLMIHGDQDTLIPYEQTLRLFELCKSDIKILFLPEGIGHNNFLLDRDIVEPIIRFATRIRDHRFALGIDPIPPPMIDLSLEYLRPPSLDRLPAAARRELSESKGLESGSRRGSTGSVESKSFEIVPLKHRTGVRAPIVPDAAVEPDHDLLIQLVQMGFPENMSISALKYSRNDLNSALEYLLQESSLG